MTYIYFLYDRDLRHERVKDYKHALESKITVHQ